MKLYHLTLLLEHVLLVMLHVSLVLVLVMQQNVLPAKLEFILIKSMNLTPTDLVFNVTPIVQLVQLPTLILKQVV